MEHEKLTNSLINDAQMLILNEHLKRNDSSFLNVVLVTGKVCVYSFEDVWTDLNIEGTMHIYRRNSNPAYRLIVFNRCSLNDFKLNCSSDFSFEIKENFVIFRTNGFKNTFGFWFDNENDAILFCRQLENILGKSVE